MKYLKKDYDEVLWKIDYCNEQIRRYKEKIQADGCISEQEYTDMLDLEEIVKRLRRL